MRSIPNLSPCRHHLHWGRLNEKISLLEGTYLYSLFASMMTATSTCIHFSPPSVAFSSNRICVNDNVSGCSSIHIPFTLLHKASHSMHNFPTPTDDVLLKKNLEMIDTYIERITLYMQRNCSVDIIREMNGGEIISPALIFS